MSHAKKRKDENKDYYRTLSCNIRYLRERQRLSTAELSAMAGISVSYLCSLESPSNFDNPSMEVLFDLSRALGISPDMFFRDYTNVAALDSTYQAVRPEQLIAEDKAFDMRVQPAMDTPVRDLFLASRGDFRTYLLECITIFDRYFMQGSSDPARNM